LDTGTRETVSVSVTSTKGAPSPLVFTLTETGVDTGIFGDDVTMRFMNGYDALPLGGSITVSHENSDENADSESRDIYNINIITDSEPGGVTIGLTETGLDTSTFSDQITFITGDSSGNSIKAADGNFIQIVSGVTAFGFIGTNPSGTNGALRVSTTQGSPDTMTVTYQDVSDTGTVSFQGFAPGGGGGGLVRPSLVLDILAALIELPELSPVKNVI